MSKPKHDVWFEPHGEFGPEAVCLCGWRKRHARAKVRNAAATKHLARVLAALAQPAPSGALHETEDA